MGHRCLTAVAGALVALVFAQAGEAALPQGNLIQNPGAEAGAGAANSSDTPPVPSWATTSTFTAVQYVQNGNSDFPDMAASARIGGGANFFAGGPDSPVSTATQVVDVSGGAADIDAGRAQATLAGDLGGWEGQEDGATVEADYLDAS